MPKAYWIAHVEVHDLDEYKKYIDGARPAFERYGAKFLARGGEFEILEGAEPGSRNVVIEFESIDKARECYNSAEYQAARKYRLPVAEANMMLVEGTE